jgi:hypothetical protein
MNASQYESAEKISAVYAATDATCIEMDFPASMETMPTSIMKFGKTFHLLTPEYWAWFNNKYHLMEQALVNKKISEKAFVEILNRISALYNHALAHYSRDILKEAERTTDVKEWEKALQAPARQPESRPDQLPSVNKSENIAASRSAAVTQTALAF